jgi:hypothetical protein
MGNSSSFLTRAREWRHARGMRAASHVLSSALGVWLALAGCALPIIGAQASEGAARAEVRRERRPARQRSASRAQPARARAREQHATAVQPARRARVQPRAQKAPPPALPEPRAQRMPSLSLMRPVATRGTCYEQLGAAGVALERVSSTQARGVQNPIRLRGPIGGVEIVQHDRRAPPQQSILDCRLALAVLDWAPTLRRAGVRRIEHYSIYRPGARVGGDGKRSGHALGMALDAAKFHLDNGEVVDVLTDWEDRDRGESPCPKRSDEAWQGRLLRDLVCHAVDRNLFQVVITPHHDKAHENHVHLELRPEVDWTYVR